MLTDHNNLRRFMDTKRLSGRQVRWAQELSRYYFRIDYRQGTHNPANALSRPAQQEANDDELIVENTRILHKLQESLSANNPVNLWACTALKPSPSIKLEGSKAEFSLDYQENMLKVIMCGTVVVPRLVQAWAKIRSVMATESPYITTGLLFPSLPSFYENDEGAQVVRKRLSNADVNAFSGVSGDPWKESEGVFYYDNKPYISETLRTEIMACYHDDPLAGHFGIEKTQ